MPKSCPSLIKQVEGGSKLGEIVKYQKWQQKGGPNMGQYKALSNRHMKLIGQSWGTKISLTVFVYEQLICTNESLATDCIIVAKKCME